MYCLAIHCSIVAIMNKSQQDGWLAHQQKDLSTEGKEKKKTKGEAAATKLGWTNLLKPAKNQIIKFVKLTDHTDMPEAF